MKTRTLVQFGRFGNSRHRTDVLLMPMLMVMMHGLASGQALSESQESASPSFTTAQVGPGDNQSSSLQNRLPEQIAASPCLLQVPDSNLLPPGEAREALTTTASSTNELLLYAPLSPRCKFDLFLTTTHSPYTFLSAGFQATLDQAQGQWPHYGGGMQGWGKRFGATLADTESRRFIQTFALSAILHQDPRYFPSHRKSLLARSWYAATRVVITRNDAGNNTFNTSEFLGALFTSALQNSYYPRHDRTFGDTMNRFSGALSSDALGNLLKEFTPDMKRLFRKHAPKKILRIEEKLPIPADDKA
jgi:hypothetical protein